MSFLELVGGSFIMISADIGLTLELTRAGVGEAAE